MYVSVCVRERASKGMRVSIALTTPEAAGCCRRGVTCSNLSAHIQLFAGHKQKWPLARSLTSSSQASEGANNQTLVRCTFTQKLALRPWRRSELCSA